VICCETGAPMLAWRQTLAGSGRWVSGSARGCCQFADASSSDPNIGQESSNKMKGSRR